MQDGRSALVWLIIGIVLAAAVGPLFWLLPTQRDRRQAEFREAARRLGLVVELKVLPNIDAPAEDRVSAGGKPRQAKLDCVCYRLALPRPMDRAPIWLLVKSARENRYLAGWTALEPPRQLPVPQASYWRDVGAIIDALPGGCRAVEAGVRHVAWCGRELLGDGTVESVVQEILRGLETLAALHRELDERAP